MPQPDWAAWLAAAVIGVAISITELLVRYEGRLALIPGVFRAPVAAYIALNAVASLAAIAILQARGGVLGLGDVLLAGVSAGIVLRAGVTVSLPNGRQTTKGAGERLQALLQVADRAVRSDLRMRFEGHAVQLFRSVPGFNIEALVDYVSIREALSLRDKQALKRKIDALENKSQLKGDLFLAGLALALHDYCTLPTLEAWRQHVRVGAQPAQADLPLVLIRGGRGRQAAEVPDVTEVGWALMDKNRATYSLKSDLVHALPKGAIVERMTGWSPPVAVPFEYRYTWFGKEVVRIDFRASFRHSGKFKNTGHYVATATVRVVEHHVSVFNTVDVLVKPVEPVNVGDLEDPIASISLLTEIRHKSLFNHCGKIAVVSFNGKGDVRGPEWNDMEW